MRNTRYGPLARYGSLWYRCVSVLISEHMHNTLGGGGDHVGMALSCLISNGRLPGDSACQPSRAPSSSHNCHMGGLAPLPLAGPEQVPTPALLALLWHCHRACPAHCQLPTLGQRMQQPLPACLPT